MNDEISEIRCSCEIREDVSRESPGRIYGEILTYGQRAKSLPEVFEPGAFDLKAIAESGGVVLDRQHDRTQPIMRFTPELRGNSIVIDALLPDSRAGRDTATEIRSGLFTGLSVRFTPQAQTFTNGLRRVTKARMVNVALVDDPSYPQGAVEIRQQPAGREGRTRRWR